MENEINNTPIKSSKAFLPKEKAYHVYQFSLQKQCYGIGVRNYAKRHDITRDTLRDWIIRYPKGLPYYNVGDPTEPMEELEDFKPHKIVKLSKNQLKGVSIEEENNAVAYNTTVCIHFCGAKIEVSSENLMTVLTAIRTVNGLVP